MGPRKADMHLRWATPQGHHHLEEGLILSKWLGEAGLRRERAELLRTE